MRRRAWAPDTWAPLRLLIKTRQCCRLSDLNGVFSARCQWRLQLEKCRTNRSHPANMSNFHYCFVRQKLRINFAITCLCCGFFFHPCSFLANVITPQEPRRTANTFWADKAIIFPAIIANSITSITPYYIIHSNFISPASPYHKLCGSSQCLPAFLNGCF